MKRHMTTLTVSASIILMLSAGCSKDPLSSSDMGTMQVNLTDAPGDYDEVLITFSEVAVHRDSAWTILSSTPKTVDLLKLANGQSTLLGEGELEAGHYTQVRLMVTSARVVVDSQSYNVTIPSSSQTGLKLNGQFTVEPGIMTSLMVDFDASRSIHATGQSMNNLMLRPVIRAVKQDLAGGISGKITNFQHLPVAYAIADTDTVTSTMVNGTTGDFLLSFLPAGTYTVSVKDTLNQTASVSGVLVVAGQSTGTGQLTLQ